MANHSRANHRPAAGSPSTRRRFSVYDGRRRLGDFIWNEATRQALAWDASRRLVGRFGSYQAAARAISRAAVTARKAVEARRRLDDPTTPFTSGLPKHFLRRG
jgi:hypothetical protein